MNREEAIIDLKAKVTRIKSILDDGLCANLDRWAIKLTASKRDWNISHGYKEDGK